jgi:nitrate/nitrite transporter NarK
MRLTGQGLTALRLPFAGVRATGARPAPVVTAMREGGELNVRWDPSYPLAVIRDAATGAILSLARGNGGGRIAGGFLSDRFGRKPTLLVAYLSQAVAILLLAAARPDSILGSGASMVALSALIGANYGANLSQLPSITRDYYGLRHFGVNYGLVFTAWGLGGFTLSLIAGAVFDRTHSFAFAYYGSAVMLVAAAAATLLLKPPQRA